jgi:hypothetical protein
MEAWQKVLLRSAGFGVAAAFTLAVIAGGVVWWSERPPKPKPMNPNAITATFAGIAIGVKEEVFYLTVTYGLRNNTEKDYQLPSIGWFMVVNPDNKGLDTINGIKWNSDVVIPPGQTVNVKFEIPYPLSDYNSTALDLTPVQKEIEFAQRRMKEIGGFRFFDNTQRYEIDFPKWPASTETP